MKKRLLIYGGLALTVVALILTGCVGPGATLSNYVRIHSGMTASEVEALLDVKGNGPAWRFAGNGAANQGWGEAWRSYAGTITIVYDTRGRVVAKEWCWDTNRGSFFGDLTGAPVVRE